MGIRHILCVAAASLAAGCSLFTPDAAVSVLIPAPPGHWLHAFPGMRFDLEYWDSEGSRRTLEVTEWWLPASLSCSKAANTPILGYPRINGGREADEDSPGSLRPAGGLYPLSLVTTAEGEAVQLSWQEGPLAALVARLQAGGLDVSLLNAARLQEYMESEEDPWSLDLDTMAESLADGGFTEYDVEHLPCREARIETGEGTWFLESPFNGWRTAEAGVVALPDVSLGIHGVYSADGGSFLLMQVGEEGVVMAPNNSRQSP